MKLNEICQTEKLDLTEAADGSVTMRIPFMVADTVNANKRRYPMEVLKGAVADLKTRLTKRTAYGSSAHMKELEVNDVAHMITDVGMAGKTVQATVKVLPTTRGRNLLAILKAGGRVGVSARGTGNVVKTADGIDEVQGDYKMDGFDFVMAPSFDLHADSSMIMESAPVDDKPKAPGLESFSSDVQRLDERLRRERLERHYDEALRAGWGPASFEEYCATIGNAEYMAQVEKINRRKSADASLGYERTQAEVYNELDEKGEL